MKILYEKSFYRDLEKIESKRIRAALLSLIRHIKASQNPQEIPGLKKLKGSKNYYRIRLRDYRLGLKIEKDTVTLIRFLSRKDIYRKFPPR